MHTFSIHQIGVPAFVVDVIDDRQFRLSDANEADCALFNLKADDVIGKMIVECTPPDVFERISCRYIDCLDCKSVTQYDEMLPIDGKEKWWRTTLTPILGDGGRVVQIFGIAVDITERKNLEATLFDAANRDPLTGVANRRFLKTVVADAMSEAVYSNRIFGLIMIDLDGFKAVNDEFGHRKGDEILRHVASLLSRAARDGEVVARIGGDEFAMKVTAASELELAAIVDSLRRRIDEESAETCHLAKIGLSIGGALWQPGQSFDDLLSVADERMYRDKSLRRGSAKVALDELDEFAGTRIREVRKSRTVFALRSFGASSRRILRPRVRLDRHEDVSPAAPGAPQRQPCLHEPLPASEPDGQIVDVAVELPPTSRDPSAVRMDCVLFVDQVADRPDRDAGHITGRGA